MEDNLLIAELEKEFRKIHKKINKEINACEILYHYTNYEGLQGILKQRKLRYTDYRYFNDPTEIKYGMALIKESLWRITNLDIRDKVYPLASMFFDEFDNHYKFYVACFSKEIKRLALWRYYANNGSGFAIGFNKKFHSAEENKFTQISDQEYIKQLKTELRYGIEAAQEIINEFLEISEKFFYKTINQSEHERIIITHLLAHLTSLLPMFKNESFEDEAEIRFSCCEGELMSNPRTGKIPYYFEDKYRGFIPIPFKNNLPFVHQRFGKKPVLLPHEFDHTDISEIWIGPCCEFLEARTAIRKLLTENGFDWKKIQIEKVSLPYQHNQ